MIKHIHTVGIYVRDQDTAVAFYTDKLGFEVVKDIAAGDGRWVEVAPPGAASTLCLTPVGYAPNGEDDIGKYTGISLYTDDIKALHEELTSRGVKFLNEPQLMPYGMWFASLADQDGNEYFVHQTAAD